MIEITGATHIWPQPLPRDPAWHTRPFVPSAKIVAVDVIDGLPTLLVAASTLDERAPLKRTFSAIQGPVVEIDRPAGSRILHIGYADGHHFLELVKNSTSIRATVENVVAGDVHGSMFQAGHIVGDANVGRARREPHWAMPS